ncbi:hypothetical protein HK098_001049, partial [Nowakowskiella sp. JEL0407]
MESLKSHQISFIIPTADRSSASQWVSEVSQFFHSISSDSQFIVDSGTKSILESVSNRVGLVGLSTPPHPLNNVDDMLEGLVVHSAVQIVSMLGHYLERVRVGGAVLLFKLATVLDKRALEVKKRLDKITLGFQIDDKGYHTAVHELFHYIGPALSSISVALISGLECFYTCSDWNIRGICTSALSRIVYENEKVFLEEDHLTAIWNLFFSLNFVPLWSKVFPDRVVVVK